MSENRLPPAYELPSTLPPGTQYQPPPGPPPTQQNAPPAEPQPGSGFGADDIATDELPPAYSSSSRNPIVSRIDNDVKLINISSLLTSRLEGRTSPLDPPPPCFSTPSPMRIRSHSFEPFRIPSVSARIVDGFQPLYASEQLSTHGIVAEDWADFLLGIDLAIATAGQPKKSLQSNKHLGPFVIGGLAGRGFAGHQYNAAFAKSALEEAMAIIAVWQDSAFHRRKLRVSLHPRMAADGRTAAGMDLLVEAL